MTTLTKRKNNIPKYLGILVFAIILTSCSGGLLGNSNWPGISVKDETIFISLGQYVHAVDVDSGGETCRFPRESDRGVNFFAPALAVEDNIVIVGDFNGMVYGFDSSRNCSELWRKELSEDFIIGGPVMYDDIVLIPSADGNLYALSYDLSSASIEWVAETNAALWSSPLVSDGVIYQSSMDHNLYALNPENGSVIWSEDLGAAILDTPTETDDLVLVGTFGNQLVAIDKARGGISWTFDTGSWVWGNPLVIEDIAYFGDVAGNLYSVNINSGRPVRDSWQADGPITASPVAAGELIYFVTETGTLYARTSSSFSPNWVEELGGALYSEPIVKDGTIFISVISQDVPLQALRADSSARIWTFTPAED